MTHEQWNKSVRKKLIDRDETVSQMAVHIGLSPEHVRRSLYGREVRAKTVKKISDYVGVKSYL